MPWKLKLSDIDIPILIAPKALKLFAWSYFRRSPATIRPCQHSCLCPDTHSGSARIAPIGSQQNGLCDIRTDSNSVHAVRPSLTTLSKSCRQLACAQQFGRNRGILALPDPVGRVIALMRPAQGAS